MSVSDRDVLGFRGWQPRGPAEAALNQFFARHRVLRVFAVVATLILGTILAGWPVMLGVVLFLVVASGTIALVKKHEVKQGTAQSASHSARQSQKGS
jgi:type III secretory pathway component EscV